MKSRGTKVKINLQRERSGFVLHKWKTADPTLLTHLLLYLLPLNTCMCGCCFSRSWHCFSIPVCRTPWIPHAPISRPPPFYELLIPCYTYTLPQYDLKNRTERAWTAWKRSGRISNLFGSVICLRTLLDELGRVWSRWPLKILNRLKHFEKPSRPQIRRSAIVPKTRSSYCERNCRTAIVLRTFWDVVRPSCC